MRWVRAGFLPVSMMILVVAAMVVPLPMFVVRPGQIVPLAACVAVSDDAATPVEGNYLLMTITVLRATVADVATAAFEADAAVMPQGRVLPPGEDADTYFRQQRHEFETAADVAAGVGLEAAGHQISISGEGALLVHVAGDMPAAEGLRPGDVVVGVDGAKIETDVDLREAIRSKPAGEPLHVEVQREGRSVTVEVAAVDVDGTPQLGVVPETFRQRVHLPVDVELLSGPVGGPSGGLMIALTVYDMIREDVDLAAGRVIAGTGTMDATGRVAPVGGIDLKVLAASRRGADVFLAPELHAETARAAVPEGSNLRVVAVESFDQARQALLDDATDTSRRAPPSSGNCPYADRS